MTQEYQTPVPEEYNIMLNGISFVTGFLDLRKAEYSDLDEIIFKIEDPDEN